MYDGHHLIKICGDTWVFDITEFLGYKVKLEKDNKTVKSFELAFSVIEDGKQLVFEKHLKVPAKILKRTVDIINQYEQEAFLK